MNSEYTIVPESTATHPSPARTLLKCGVGTFTLEGSFTKMNSLARLQPFGLLALRIALGVIFIAHGYPKLIRSNAEMQHMFVQHGLPAQFVYVAGVIEAFGGGLLVLGLFTRPAALLLAIEMSVAIWKVHSSGGILAVHVYEFPFALAAACLALATVGAGVLSVDEGLLGSGSRKFRAPKRSKE